MPWGQAGLPCTLRPGVSQEGYGCTGSDDRHCDIELEEFLGSWSFTYVRLGELTQLSRSICRSGMVALVIPLVLVAGMAYCPGSPLSLPRWLGSKSFQHRAYRGHLQSAGLAPKGNSLASWL